jgi:hypothetical protein
MLFGASVWHSIARGDGDAGHVPSWKALSVATREFLRVPAGAIHLRAAPWLDERAQNGHADPGTLDTDGDALHEFFREDTRHWSVDLTEVAVGSKGTLTVEVVDRPSPVDAARQTFARLKFDVEPGKPILIGTGFEGLGARAMTAPVGQNLLPDWAADEPQRPPESSRLASVRVRLLGAGGRVAGASGSTLSREYTSGGGRSAWGRTNTTEALLSLETRSSLDGLSFDSVPGGAHRFFTGPGHVEARAGEFVNLGVLFWSPTRDSGTFHSSDARDVARHDLGPVTVRFSDREVAVSVNDQPVALGSAPYPVWVSRIRFEPASSDGK